jgi:hypothetical protein
LELALSTAPWVTVPNVDEPPAPGAAPSAKLVRREELRELRLATVRAMRQDLLSPGQSGAFPSHVLEAALDDLDREELAIDVAPETHVE